MRSIAVAISIVGLCGVTWAAEQDKTRERLDDSAALFNEIMQTSDRAIPQDLLNKSQCIILVPGLKKGGFVLAAKFGRGFVSCRRGGGQGWGPPGAVRIEGGSVGLQLGVSSTDLVLLVMNERGMRKLLSSKFTLGGEASVAAGPVGRDATAQTDAMLTAEILSWSRSKGVFAGVSVDGSTLRNDVDENERLYGKRWENKQILNSGLKPPATAGKLMAVLNKYSPRKTS
jgi:lipid-binding SYLF domain-containing protein